MSHKMLPALAASLMLTAAPAMAASVSTAWAELPRSDQEECLEIGTRAAQSLGFRPNISRDRQTIFAWRGEEALTIRCISGRGIAVVFAWVSDRANDSGRLVDAVTNAYRNGGVAPQGNLGGGNLGGGNPGGGNPGGGQFGGGQGGVVKR